MTDCTAPLNKDYTAIDIKGTHHAYCILALLQ